MLEERSSYLTLDVGSSHSHVGIFNNQNLEKISPLNSYQFSGEKLNMIASNVAMIPPAIKRKVASLISVGELRKDDGFLGMPIHYSQTLGEDRLTQVFYLYNEVILKKNLNAVLLLDAGTFLTVDLVTRAGHQGGNIVPGLTTLIESFHKGQKLPRISNQDVDFNRPISIPRDTKEAMVQSIIALYVGFFEKIFSLSPGVSEIYLTGGECRFFRGLCERFQISYQLSPELIHHSLSLVYCLKRSRL